MSSVWEWVKNITLVVILFSFVEILLPESSMRKFLKFIFSLAVLAMILSPLLTVNQEEISVLGRVPVSGQPSGQGYDSRDEDAITKVQTKQIETVYKEKLISQLTDELKENFHGITVTSVEIYINNKVRSSGFGKPEHATITIDDPDYEKVVRDFTADRLRIEKRSVTIALTGE